jgi:hypothetical protein
MDGPVVKLLLGPGHDNLGCINSNQNDTRLKTSVTA